MLPAFASCALARGVAVRSGCSALCGRRTWRPAAASATPRWRACAGAGCGGDVTRATVEHTVKLAHLDMSEEEIDRLTPEFKKIVGFIDTLTMLDVEGVEPMSRVEDSRNVVRDDVPAGFPDVDGIMAAAPLVEKDFIRVPKISSESSD